MRSAILARHIPVSFFDLIDFGLRELRLEDTQLLGMVGSMNETMSSQLEVLSFAGSKTLMLPIGPLLHSPQLRYLNVSESMSSFHVTALRNLSHLEYANLDMSLVRGSWGDGFWASVPTLKFFSAYKSVSLAGKLGEIMPPQLEYLKIVSTQVSGTIPPAIGRTLLKNLTLLNNEISGSVPSEIGLLNATLTQLILSLKCLTSSTIPASIGALKQLSHLEISSSRLKGPIPPNFADLPHLAIIKLSENYLNDTIPDFSSPYMDIIDLSKNNLVGTIPSLAAAHASSIILSNNHLGPTLDVSLFEGNPRLKTLVLSFNQFSSPLPNIHPSATPVSVEMSYNSFNGTVPLSYSQLIDLKLDHNQLCGDLEFLVSPTLHYVFLDHNQFNGTVPSLSTCDSMRTLQISHNKLHGTFPLLPRGILSFSAANNRLDDKVRSSTEQWVQTVSCCDLTHLDISNNGATFLAAWFELFGPRLRRLYVANNTFLRDVQLESNVGYGLTAMDLSGCGLYGAFPAHLFTRLTVLKLANNHFTGLIDVQQLQSLTELDISNNKFEMDAAQFSSLPLLSLINARNNKLYGSLNLGNMPSLQSADFSSNSLDKWADLVSIAELFDSAHLQMLNITNNTRIPSISDLDSAHTGLGRSQLSSPSLFYPKSVTCYTLDFWNKAGRTFSFDEGLFEYQQCDCNDYHFGLPPLKCFKCPTRGTTSCGGSSANISTTSYAFLIDEPTETLEASSSFGFGLFSSFFDSPPTAAPLTPYRDNNNRSGLHIETESCLISVIQTLSGVSNCQGVLITSADFIEDKSNQSSLQSISSRLNQQCKPGSEGRLCSKCICSPKGDGECWFMSGAKCSKCRHVFGVGTSIPLVIGMSVVVVGVLSVVMMIVIERRRVQSLESFSELKLWKRIFYRLQYMTTLGNVSILVTFVQMLIEFTQWDAYARFEFIGILNGETQGLGVRCLFPFLAEPLPALIARLSVPFFGVLVVGLCVWLGSVLANIIKRKKFEPASSSYTSDLLSSDDESLTLISSESSPLKTEAIITYPTFAMFTSLSITVVKFFYFGTALAAHQYLFSVRQAYTHVEYAQNDPWMTYSSALPLILASIPSIIIFDLIIPLSFIVVCWKVRDQFKLRNVQIYYGSLFSTYNPRCFWWEIVNILRKLSIALVLEGFSSTDTLQTALVVSILAGTLLVQLTLRPWRRKSENFFDSASSLLLIAALLYTRPTQHANAAGVIWYVFALSIAFVVTMLLVICYQTVTGTTDFEAQQALYLTTMELNTQEETHILEKWNTASD